MAVEQARVKQGRGEGVRDAGPGASQRSADGGSALIRRCIVLLAAASLCSGMALRVNDALLPRLGAEFGVDLGQAAQVIGLFALAYGLAQLLFGPLGDRHGKVRVVAWAAAASALSSLLCALALDFDQLRAARVLAGATAAAVIPLSMAWIGDVVPYERRQPVLARFLVGQILGLALGVWLGGVAAEHGSWRLPYVTLTLLFAAVSLALLWIAPRLPERARQRRRAQGSAMRRMAAEFGQILALPWARVVLLTVFAEGMALYGPFAFIAAHLHQRFGLPLSLAGALLMAYGLGGFVFALGSARLVTRLGEVGLVRWGGALLLLALLLLALLPVWWLAAPACLLAGLGFYMLHNTLQLNATQMAPQQRGSAVSAFAGCFFLGQSAGVALGGRLVGLSGTGTLLAAGGVAVCAVAWLFAGLRRRRD